MVTLIRDITVIDVVGMRVLEGINIVIDEGEIVDISPQERKVLANPQKEIDGSGLFALPGLIDLHTHLIWSGGNDPLRDVEEEGGQLSLLRAACNARKTLEAGITCVRDLGSNDDATIYLSKAISKGYLPGPRIISSGCTIIMTGGHDPFWGCEADGKYELIKAVRTQIAKGARVIKISATGGVYGRQEGEDVGASELTSEEIKTVCDEAHRFGLKVAAHAISENGIVNCLEAGVDTIEHGHFMTEELLQDMKKQGAFWVPTLFVYKQIADGEGLPAYAVEKAKKITDIHRQAFQNGLKAGVCVGCGSDAGSPNTPHGSLLNELEMMVEYGCDSFTALKSATIDSAKALGLEKQLGSIEVGKKADLLILKENPVDNISSIRSKATVMIGGDLLPLC